MTDILFTANGASATALVSGELTSGMVGLPVRLSFDSDWDGLNIVAVFDGGGQRISIPLLTDMEAVLPWEVIAKANTRLRIGAEGRKSDGSIVIPTVWANAGYITEGAVATDEEGNPPTPGIYDQIMAAIEAGKLKGEKGPAGPAGPQGEKGEKGDKGDSPIIVDDLYTQDITKALSARQGAILREKIDDDVLAAKNALEAQVKERVKTVNGVAPDENGNVNVEGGTGGVAVETDPTVPAWAKNATKPSYSKSEVGLGNVDNVKQYSASNPPPYPVTSVNGKTGAVTLDAAAVGARPSSWMPSASDVGALPASTTIPTKVSQLTNDKGYLTEHQDISGKLDASALPTAIDTALAQAKASGEFDGATGRRGTGLLAVTTAPASYTTAVGGITPKYRMELSTIKTQAGVTEVLLGDTVRYSYYHYPIDYLDASYAYFTERVSIRGATGAAGKDAVLTMFISPDGSDSNDGLTASTPKKTVAACVAAGAKRISAKRGVYAEQVAISGIDHLEIFPTDNNQEYSTSADWHPIVFDLSDTISVGSLAAYNSIKRVAYSNSANEQFDKVFTKKSQTPVGDEYGSRYNATIWLLSNDEKTVCKKLKPVLTVAECEAESNTFTWVSNYIYINADLAGVEKVCVPTNFDSGFRIADAGKVILREVEVRFSGSYNVWLLNCPYFDFYKVSARYSSYASGIDIDNANGTLTACYATKNFDGFGISGYGHTTYIDCVSEFNFDDGVSHHNGSCGTFIGGRYEGNGKGGNTPAYGAQVNIYGGIYKDNAQFGIGYLYTSGKNPAGGMVQGAVMAGNPVGLNVDKNCVVTAINCLYKDNTADKSIKGTLTEYNPPVSGGSDEPGETGPVNLLPLAINSDGTLYVGTNGEKGYKTGYRLNSSGLEKEQTGCMVTGFIPAKAGDIVRIENFTPNTAGYGYMHIYKSDFTKYGTPMQGGAMESGIVDGVLTVDISEQFAGNGADTCAYFRISVTEITDNTIITVTPKA